MINKHEFVKEVYSKMSGVHNWKNLSKEEKDKIQTFALTKKSEILLKLYDLAENDKERYEIQCRLLDSLEDANKKGFEHGKKETEDAWNRLFIVLSITLGIIGPLISVGLDNILSTAGNHLGGQFLLGVGLIGLIVMLIKFGKF